MHAAGGHANASGRVRREGSVEEQPGRELTDEVERKRQRETFACDALTVRCRGRIPPRLSNTLPKLPSTKMRDPIFQSHFCLC